MLVVRRPIFSLRTAANGAAPDGSTRSFARSRSSDIADLISSSVTRTISSTHSLMIWNVLSPERFTARPSAIVSTLSISTTFPVLSDVYIAADPNGWTPKTLIRWLICLAVRAMPDISAPPPTGTTMTSMSGASSRISRPMLPWPIIIAGSSNAWRYVIFFSSLNSRAFWKSSVDVEPCRRTSAP